MASRTPYIHFKVQYGDDIRRFAICSSSVDWNALVCKLRDTFKVNHFTIRYRDEDGDFVTLSNSDDLVCAIASSGVPVRLVLEAISAPTATEAVSPTASPSTSTEIPSATQRTPQAQAHHVAAAQSVDVVALAAQLSESLISHGIPKVAGVVTEAVNTALRSVADAIEGHHAGLLASLAEAQATQLAALERSIGSTGGPTQPQQQSQHATADGVGSDANSRVLHDNVRCDGCQQDIYGIRYKCGNCPDFDLCERCEGAFAALGSHDATHVFLKIRVPVPRTHLFFGRFHNRSLLGGNLYEAGPSVRRGGCTRPVTTTFYTTAQPVAPCTTLPTTTATAANGAAAPAEDCRAGQQAQFGWPRRPTRAHNYAHPHFHGDADKHKGHGCHGLHAHGGKHRRDRTGKDACASTEDVTTIEQKADVAASVFTSALDTAAATATATTTTTSSAPAVAIPVRIANPRLSLHSKFVRDVNFPDGSELPVGSEFVKTWTMTNVGSVAWPADVALEYVSGTLVPCMKAFPIGAVVEPGESYDISATLSTPRVEGRHLGIFQLSLNSRPFGHRVWCDICVVAKPPNAVSEERPAASVVPLFDLTPATYTPALLPTVVEHAAVTSAPSTPAVVVNAQSFSVDHSLVEVVSGSPAEQTEQMEQTAIQRSAGDSQQEEQEDATVRSTATGSVDGEWVSRGTSASSASSVSRSVSTAISDFDHLDFEVDFVVLDDATEGADLYSDAAAPPASAASASNATIASERIVEPKCSDCPPTTVYECSPAEEIEMQPFVRHNHNGDVDNESDSGSSDSDSDCEGHSEDDGNGDENSLRGALSSSELERVRQVEANLLLAYKLIALGRDSEILPSPVHAPFDTEMTAEQGSSVSVEIDAPATSDPIMQPCLRFTPEAMPSARIVPVSQPPPMPNYPVAPDVSYRPSIQPEPQPQPQPQPVAGGYPTYSNPESYCPRPLTRPNPYTMGAPRYEVVTPHSMPVLPSNSPTGIAFGYSSAHNNAVVQQQQETHTANRITNNGNSEADLQRALLDMGFFDRELNSRLIRKHRGDMSSVVGELLDHYNNDWWTGRH
eukprot:Opistho-2@97145